MRKPKQPIKPHKPIEPKKFLPEVKQHVSIYDGTSLSDILKAVGSVDANTVCFTSTRGYYDDYDYQFEWNAAPKVNPLYEIQMSEYTKNVKEYNKKLEVYNNDLKDYNALNKQYLRWYYESELKKL